MPVPIFKNKITLHAVFGNMHRPKHVLLVIRNSEGKFLLGEKPHFYPPQIYRLVGGGIDGDETPIEAAIRESMEELQIQVDESELNELAVIKTKGNFEGKTYTNTTYMYELKINDIESLIPGDDITGLKHLTREEVEELIQRYKDLSTDDWFESDDGYKHCWSDYGEMYSYVHQIMLDLTQ